MADSSTTSFLTGSNLTLDNLFEFQQDSIDYLYDMPPAANNLFWAGNFSRAPDRPIQDRSIKTSNLDADAVFDFHNAQFRIRSVNFPLPNLTFTKHKSTRNIYISDVANVNEVTIGWIDDAYRSVMKYHWDWSKAWYDKNYDCLVVGTGGKFRGLDVILYDYIEGNPDANSPITSVPIILPILKIKLRGLAPTNLQSFQLDYSSPGNNNILSYTYAINFAQIIYNGGFVGKRDENNGMLWNPASLGSQDALKEISRTQMSVCDVTERYTVV